MRIWVDADACPKVTKDILFRAADRVGTPLTLVANRPLRIPESPHIRSIIVPDGLDVADEHITAHIEPGDLVVTADIPLAAAVVARDAFALNPRGEFYTKENVDEHLAIRNFMTELRGSGVETGGPAAIAQSDRAAFANQLDRFLQKHVQPQK